MAAQNPNYYINPKAISFTPNYQGHKDIVYVSIVSNTAIAVYYRNIPQLGYDVDAGYQRWRLSAYTTALGTTGAYYIYARLSRRDKVGMILFSVNDYDILGRTPYIDESGDTQYTDESAEYWYVKLGRITASKTDYGTVDRILDFDSGRLGTPQGQDETNGLLETMFEWDDIAKVITVKFPFTSIIVNGLAKFVGQIELFGKKIIGLAAKPETKDDADVISASEDTLVTPAFVKAYSDFNYLSKVKDDVVDGSITFNKSVTVKLDHIVEGKQTLHQGFQTKEFNDAAGQINGAQLTAAGVLTVAGLVANSFQIQELIYNTVRAQGGKFVFSPSANIDHCVFTMMNGSTLTVAEYYEEYTHSNWGDIISVRVTLRDDEATRGKMQFVVGDIIYGKVNNIGGSGQYAVGGECLMKVIAVGIEDEPMAFDAVLFGTEDDIIGNIPPADGMAIAQRGNIFGIEGRTTIFFIDTESGNMVMLQNVTFPNLRVGDYGVVIGPAPSDLLKKINDEYGGEVSGYDPIVYAKLGVFENLIQIDHDGNPIKQENYRGQWSKGVKYVNTKTSYDSVTHKGMLWQCGVPSTEEEPGVGTDWVLKGGSADVNIYAINSSANVIYFHSTGALSNAYLEVSVSVTNSVGTTLVSSDEELQKLGLKLQYAVDGETSNRKDLPLVESGMMELEDGSGVIAAEDDGDGIENTLYIEGAELDIESVKNNVTLYLVDTKKDPTEDLSTLVIPVLRDGEDGRSIKIKGTLTRPEELPTTPDDPSDCYLIGSNIWIWDGNAWVDGGRFRGEPGPEGPAGPEGPQGPQGEQGPKGEDGFDYVLQFDPPFISHSVDPNNGMATIGSQSVTVTCTVLKNGEPISIDGFFVSAKADKGSYYVGTTNGQVNVGITPGALPAAQATKINVTITRPAGITTVPWSEFKGSIPIVYSQRGLVGAAGNAGPLIVPAGFLELGKAYNVVHDEKDEKRIVAQPLYFLKKETTEEDEGNEPGKKGLYYVLQKNITAEENTKENLSNLEYWRPFTEWDYVFTKALMAPFALLGGEEGAVFWNNYMFSTQGVQKDGTEVSSYSEKMFTNGKLNGSVVPKLFLDFKSGSSKFGKLSESYVQAEVFNELISDDKGWYSHTIETSQCHNIKCEPLINTFNKAFDGPMTVFLPMSSTDEWTEDGSHCSIVHEYSPSFFMTPRQQSYLNSVVAVCADTRFADPDTDIASLVASDDGSLLDGNGWIVWRGYRTKFVFLHPGSMLNLRSFRTGNGNIIWMVDNSADFTILNARVQFDGQGYAINSHETTAVEAHSRSPIVVGSATLNHYWFNNNTQAYDVLKTSKWTWSPAAFSEDIYFRGKGLYLVNEGYVNN